MRGCMRRKKPIDPVDRKNLSAAIDIRVVADLKKLSKEINKPVYLMLEEALKTYILRKRKFHKNRIARIKSQSGSATKPF